MAKKLTIQRCLMLSNKIKNLYKQMEQESVEDAEDVQRFFDKEHEKDSSRQMDNIPGSLEIGYITRRQDLWKLLDATVEVIQRPECSEPTLDALYRQLQDMYLKYQDAYDLISEQYEQDMKTLEQ